MTSLRAPVHAAHKTFMTASPGSDARLVLGVVGEVLAMAASTQRAIEEGMVVSTGYLPGDDPSTGVILGWAPIIAEHDDGDSTDESAPTFHLSGDVRWVQMIRGRTGGEVTSAAQFLETVHAIAERRGELVTRLESNVVVRERGDR